MDTYKQKLQHLIANARAHYKQLTLYVCCGFILALIGVLLFSHSQAIYSTPPTDKQAQTLLSQTPPCITNIHFVDGNYLTTQGSDFMYMGQRVCLYGATIYTSSGPGAPTSNWSSPSFTQRIDWDLNQAQAAHLNIIRPTDEANNSSNDPYNPVIWANMDYLVQQARLRGMFVLIDLSTFANHLTNQTPSVNPFDPAALPQWQQFISFVVSRYKDAPNVSNFKVIGEVNPPGSSLQPQSTTQGYINFFSATTAFIHQIDGGHHLIAAGGLTHLDTANEVNCVPTQNCIPWQQIFSLPYVNMASIHIYSANRLDPIIGSKDLHITLPMVSQWAQQSDPASGRPKPIQIEEYGIAQENGDVQRAADMQIIQQAAIQYNVENLIQWNLGPQLTTLTPRTGTSSYSYDVGPQTPASWQQLIAGALLFYNNTPIPSLSVTKTPAIGIPDTTTPTPFPTLTTAIPTDTTMPTLTSIPVTPLTSNNPLITNVQINSKNHSKWHVQSNLQIHDIQYGDRNYTFSKIPSSLLGADWIQTANADKTANTSPLVSFTVSRQVIVSVVWDQRAKIPNWLSDWNRIVQTIQAGGLTYNIYQLIFPSGIVQLGPENQSFDGHSMYSIIVQ